MEMCKQREALSIIFWINCNLAEVVSDADAAEFQPGTFVLTSAPPKSENNHIWEAGTLIFIFMHPLQSVYSLNITLPVTFLHINSAEITIIT